MMMNHRRLNVTRRKSKENPFKGVPLLFLLIVTIILSYAECFAFQMNRPLQSSFTRHDNSQITTLNIRRLSGPQTRQSRLYTSNDDEDARVEEEVRIRVLGDRRNQIRSALKSAEKLRNFRLSNGRLAWTFFSRILIPFAALCDL